MVTGDIVSMVNTMSSGSTAENKKGKKKVFPKAKGLVQTWNYS